EPDTSGPRKKAPVGTNLRIYRLALISDPSYAEYWEYEDDPENVTIGKVLAANRLSQIYEDSLSIRFVLANGTDKLNFNTNAQATGTNGPCGQTACFTGTQLENCNDYTRAVLPAGLLVGADN